MKKIIFAVGLLIYGVILIMQMASGSDCTEEYADDIKKICSKKENITLWEQTFATGKSDEIKKVKYSSVNLKDFFFKDETKIHYMEEAGKIYYVTLTVLRDSDCQGSSGDFSITPLITPRCWFGDNIRGYTIRLDLISEDADSFRLFPENTRYYYYVYDKKHVYFNGFYRSDDADPASLRRVVTDNPDKKLPEKLYSDNQHLYLDYRKIADESWDSLTDVRIIPVSADWNTLISGVTLTENRAAKDDSGIILKKGGNSGQLYLFSDDDVAVSTAADIPVTAEQQCYLNNIVVCHIGGDFYKTGYRYDSPVFEKITDENRSRISKEWDNLLLYY